MLFRAYHMEEFLFWLFFVCACVRVRVCVCVGVCCVCAGCVGVGVERILQSLIGVIRYN